MIAELDELKLLERSFSILTNSCLVVIPMYDVFLLQEQAYFKTTFKKKRAGRRNFRLKYKIILKVSSAIYIPMPSLSRNNVAMYLPNLMDRVPIHGRIK